jgi:hypothetical protein
MKRHRPLVFAVIMMFVLGFLVIEPAATVLADSQTLSSQAGQVTIKATWQGSEVGPVFTVVLDTHAVNLDAYDLVQLSALRTDQTDQVLPISWDAPAGGHHRQGTLTFPLTRADGSPTLPADATSIELSIREVGGVPETVLTWVLP